MSDAKTSMEILESVRLTRAAGVKEEDAGKAELIGLLRTHHITPRPATPEEILARLCKVGEELADLEQRTVSVAHPIPNKGLLCIKMSPDETFGNALHQNDDEDSDVAAAYPEATDGLNIAKSSTDAFDLLPDLKDGEAFKAVAKLSIKALKLAGEFGCEVPSPKLIKQLRKGDIRKIKMVDLLDFFYANGVNDVSLATALDLNPPIKYHPETGKRMLRDNVTLDDVRNGEQPLLCFYNPWTGKRRGNGLFLHDPYGYYLIPPARLKNS